MSDLIRFVIDHFRGLAPLDYILLLVLAILTTLGLLSIFRWLFEGRLAAQKDLLAIKEETIQALQRQVEYVQKDFEQATLEAGVARAEVMSLEHETQQLEDARQQSHRAEWQVRSFASTLQAAIYTQSNFIRLYWRIAILYRCIWLYSQEIGRASCRERV